MTFNLACSYRWWRTYSKIGQKTQANYPAVGPHRFRPQRRAVASRNEPYDLQPVMKQGNITYKINYKTYMHICMHHMLIPPCKMMTTQHSHTYRQRQQEESLKFYSVRHSRAKRSLIIVLGSYSAASLSISFWDPSADYKYLDAGSRAAGYISSGKVFQVFQLRAGLDAKNLAKWHCSAFRCYLANIVQSWSN
jgi:hypothetical protein